MKFMSSLWDDPYVRTDVVILFVVNASVRFLILPFTFYILSQHYLIHYMMIYVAVAVWFTSSCLTAATAALALRTMGRSFVSDLTVTALMVPATMYLEDGALILHGLTLLSSMAASGLVGLLCLPIGRRVLKKRLPMRSPTR